MTSQCTAQLLADLERDPLVEAGLTLISDDMLFAAACSGPPIPLERGSEEVSIQVGEDSLVQELPCTGP